MQFTSKTSPVLVIIGPSGAGKSSVVKELVTQGIIAVTPTWTTRPPRPGETELEHVFVSPEEFSAMKEQGYFLDTVQLFDLPHHYGMPKVIEYPERIPAIMLRSMLLPRLADFYTNPIIYQIEDDIESVTQRLEERRLHGEAMGSRLKDFQDEVAAGQKHAHRIFTNDDTVEELAERIQLALNEDFAL